IDVVAEASSIELHRGRGGLEMVLHVEWSGMLQGTGSAFADWSLALENVADLMTGDVAPAVPPADHERILHPLDQFPAEAAVAQAETQFVAALDPSYGAAAAQALICSPYGAMIPSLYTPAILAGWNGDLACASDDQKPRTFGLLTVNTWRIGE